MLVLPLSREWRGGGGGGGGGGRRVADNTILYLVLHHTYTQFSIFNDGHPIVFEYLRLYVVNFVKVGTG